MEEVAPREVIEMSMATRDEEPRRHHNGRRAGLAAGCMHEASAIGAIGIKTRLEDTLRHGRQQIAIGTTHPLWEDANRHTDQDLGVETAGRGTGLGRQRRLSQILHLIANRGPNRSQQALLRDLVGVRYGPVLEPHHHGRDVRQVDDGANTKAEEELARPQLADACPLTPHRRSPRPGRRTRHRSDACRGSILPSARRP